MKILSRVVWSEGMYLGPHHFQLQSRYFEDSIRFVIEHAWFEPWGLSSYRLDPHAIENGRVAVLSAHGIFEDGLAFAMPECDLLPVERNVRELIPADEQSVVVFLAILKRQEGGRNCDVEGSSNHCRYSSRKRSIRDTNNGIDENDVAVGEKNIAILTKDEVDKVKEGMLTIPLGRIRRDAHGVLGYDPAFVPPCTKLSASKWLLKFLGQLIEVLEEKRKALLLPRTREGEFHSGLSQMDVSKFWFLHTINDGLAQLRHLYASKQGHPEELFRELSRIAGALCTFNVESDPSRLPKYDHRQLEKCFSALRMHIYQHLEIIVPSKAIQVPIEPSTPNIYAGKVSDQRCFGRSRWVLGLGSSAGEAAVLTKAPYLVKVCSALFVGELVKRAMPGLTLIPLPVPPAAISSHVELQYFSISKSGPCWNHILGSREVGIYVPNELPNPVIDLQVVLED
jgi:type VI secretion system protein ImpJ